MTFFRTDAIVGHLASAGLTVVDTIERDPYEGVEHPSRRGSVLAKRQEWAE